ncbi:MAG: ExeA family protein [Opitutaceae bacterium]
MTAILADPPLDLLTVYRGFFGLTERPFNITPDPGFLYLGTTHCSALEQLKLGISERAGFLLLTGEVGCGKTTICRRLLAELDPQRYDTSLILTPRQTETQMLRSILADLGVKKIARTSAELITQMHDVLLERITAGKDIILVIDEAQNLSVEVLEQIRLLSNLETDKQKLLQILLTGQPELKRILARTDMRQLRQRILVKAEVKPLSRTELAQYVHHRLACAGANGRVGFTPSALFAVHWFSGGVPRIVNQLCDKALLAAFVRTSNSVSPRDVWRAHGEVNWS